MTEDATRTDTPADTPKRPYKRRVMLPKRFHVRTASHTAGKSVSSPDGIKRIPPRVLNALELMAWQGLNRREAAEGAGLSDQTMRKALTQPWVRRELDRLVELLSTSERARNIHVAVEIRDNAGNRPRDRLDSAKFLSKLADPERKSPSSVNVNIHGGVTVSPGYIVDVSQHAERAKEILQLHGGKAQVIDGTAEEVDMLASARAHKTGEEG